MKRGQKHMLSNGTWEQAEADLYHKSSPKLALFLAKYLSKDDIVTDFGCGTGFYISELASVGFRCQGVEGFKLNNFLHKNIYIKDLTQPILNYEKGTVLSFEVGEHLPRAAEQIFLNTLTENCYNKLIISWATEGQPGIGHINCRNHDYIISQIEWRGFKYHHFDTLKIRAHVDKECDWLERNLLIFDRL